MVEGQTEEAFAKRVLAPALVAHGLYIDARCTTTNRRLGRRGRGGWDSYRKLHTDLLLWMKQDHRPDSWFSTMIDLYGLPGDFPGRKTAAAHALAAARVEHLEASLRADIERLARDANLVARFIPYIQMHEFEALLFTDPAQLLVQHPSCQREVEALRAAAEAAGGPEWINEGHATAPSKRILKLIPDYTKTVSGPLTAERIGLPALRQACPHFGSWVARLLALVSAGEATQSSGG